MEDPLCLASYTGRLHEILIKFVTHNYKVHKNIRSVYLNIYNLILALIRCT